MLKVDYRKLLSQDAEFAEFYKEVVVRYQLSQPDSGVLGVIRVVYDFYQSGSKIEDAVNTMLLWSPKK